LKLFAALFLVALLSGCGFAQGFRDESARQLAQIAAEEVDRRLEGDFKDVAKDVLTGVADAIPKRDPVGDTAGYGLGALLAYVIGSFGKGKIREMRERKKEEA
jgi:hypothetical protein